MLYVGCTVQNASLGKDAQLLDAGWYAMAYFLPFLRLTTLKLEFWLRSELPEASLLE